MSIETQQVPIMKAVVKGTYAPVLRRAIINALFLGIEQIRQEKFAFNQADFLNAMHSHTGHRACRALLDNIADCKDAMIVELMKQYGIDKDKDCFNLYMDELGYWFKRHIVYIKDQVELNRYDHLAALSKETGSA